MIDVWNLYKAVLCCNFMAQIFAWPTNIFEHRRGKKTMVSFISYIKCDLQNNRTQMFCE